MSIFDLLVQGDSITRMVAFLLLGMSVASWITLIYKGWMLHRASRDVPVSTAVFWQSSSMEDALARMKSFDRDGLVFPLAEATQLQGFGLLSQQADKSPQLTRVLRDALHQTVRKLQSGQVLLATIGATAPFVGLLGTVWGIYHALVGIAASAQATIDKVAGPVGEALIMTAAGLAVAIPAVLAYNVLGRVIGRIEADLEGFANDLHGLICGPN